MKMNSDSCMKPQYKMQAMEKEIVHVVSPLLREQTTYSLLNVWETLYTIYICYINFYNETEIEDNIE